MNRIAVDTNVLVRLLTCDDPRQAEIAKEVLDKAEQVFIPTHVFCETVWVLLKVYRHTHEDVLRGIRLLTSVEKITFADDEVFAGLEQMEMGGDFADGINEYTGTKMGSKLFMTFDKKAAGLLERRNRKVLLLEN